MEELRRIKEIIAQSELIHHQVPQNTPEWLEARRAKLTASKAYTIKSAGKGLETYIMQLLEQSVSDEPIQEQYIGKSVERGNEKEPIAVIAYEFKKGVKVKKVGFMQVGDYLGFSPDLLVGDNGGLEIKCRNREKHMAYLVKEKLLPQEEYQIQMSLLLSRRKWWDFAAYNETFTQHLWVKRCYPNKEIQQEIAKGLLKGIQLLEKYTKTKNYLIELNKNL